jgi:phenylacetate-coenzyme A ligase PaaK-like adenylate-forming protein
MNRFLTKSIIFPINESLCGRKTFSALRELEKIQFADEKAINEYQFNKLKKLLIHSEKSIAYYQNVFKENSFLAARLNKISDIRRLPLLSKEIIRANTDSLIASNAVNPIRMNTGGSSGKPLVFYVDKRRQAYDKAANLRSRRWWGVDVGEREIVFWGSPIELSRQDKIKDFRDKLLNTRLFSAFNMSEEVMHEYLKIMKRFRPKQIFGYPSSIALFAGFAQKQAIDMKDVGVKTVFVTSEMLYDFQRKTIEEVFGCKVANGYGGRDGGFIAHECPHGNMHITEDVIVEIVDENGETVQEGESGEIVITHLDAYAMPFIRYRMGDKGRISRKDCSCGRKTAILEAIEGRVTDFIHTPDGRTMHALALIYVLRDIKGVNEFKIIQKQKDFLHIDIVKNSYFSDATEEIITKQIQERMGGIVRIEFSFSQFISPENNGKYRYVVSQLKQN